MDNDIEIYKGKCFSDLCKDIIENSYEKKNQIDVVISDVRKFMTSADDIIRLLPLIREYLDTGVKNDEQLIKLAAIIQRIQNKGNSGDGTDGFALTEEEKKQLMSTLNETKKPIDTAEPK